MLPRISEDIYPFELSQFEQLLEPRTRGRKSLGVSHGHNSVVLDQYVVQNFGLEIQQNLSRSYDYLDSHSAEAFQISFLKIFLIFYILLNKLMKNY